MFKDLPSSNCPVSVERSMWSMWASGSIPTGANMLLLDFFVIM